MITCSVSSACTTPVWGVACGQHIGQLIGHYLVPTLVVQGSVLLRIPEVVVADPHIPVRSEIALYAIDTDAAGANKARSRASGRHGPSVDEYRTSERLCCSPPPKPLRSWASATHEQLARRPPTRHL